MIRFTLFRLTCLAILLTSPIFGLRAQTVTMSFSAGRLYDSGGSLLPNGTLVLFLSDTLQNGFGTLSAGSLNVGDYLNGDNQILARAVIDSGFNGTGTTSGTTGAITLAGGSFPQLTTGDPVAVAWFVGLTGSSFSLSSGASYGLFTDSGWTVPSGGSTVDFPFLTSASGHGSYSDTLGRATLTTTAIPEPSTYAASAGVAMLALAFYRRRGVRRS